MTKGKDLKRHVRARMSETGESYTAARLRVLAKKKTKAKQEAHAGPDVSSYPALAGKSDEAVRAKTGKAWAQWVDALDAIGAATLSHRDIARAVVERWPEIGGWWAQSVTVGYERIRGLRAIGQRRTDHSFEAGKSRTFAVPVRALYEAFAVKRRRAQWLDVEPAMRTCRLDTSARMTWPDGTSVIAYFVAKGRAKSTVTIQHAKLASAADVERAKREWSVRLDALGAFLTK